MKSSLGMCERCITFINTIIFIYIYLHTFIDLFRPLRPVACINHVNTYTRLTPHYDFSCVDDVIQYICRHKRREAGMVADC